MIIYIYRLLGHVIPPFFLKILFWLRTRKGKEVFKRSHERYGITTKRRPSGYLVWIHGASVGELASCQPLIQALLRHNSTLNVLITSGTVTSSQFIQSRLNTRCFHQFLPYDLPSFAQKFINHWQPNLAIWVESEFWPTLLYETHKKSIPIFLMNGRISFKSYRFWRKKFSGFKNILQIFQKIFAQSTLDKERFKELGARSVQVTGNIKLAQSTFIVDDSLRNEFKEKFKNRPCFIAASTHPGEEEQVLNAFYTLKIKYPSLLLVLAPRHPHRHESIQNLIAHHHFTFCLHSEKEKATANIDIYLIDQIGLLGTFFSLCPIVFLGGTLTPIGGHNFIEPLQLGAIVIMGPYVHGQKALLEPFKDVNIPIIIKDSSELAHKIAYYLEEKDKRQEIILTFQKILQQYSSQQKEVFNQLLSVIPKS